MTTFDVPEGAELFKNIVRIGENAGNQHLSIYIDVFIPIIEILHHLIHNKIAFGH